MSRQWLQFSLRGFLVAVTLFSLWFGCLNDGCKLVINSDELSAAAIEKLGLRLPGVQIETARFSC